MKKINIPYSVIPFKILKKFSKIFYGITEILMSFSPSYRRTLAQADMPLDEREYVSMCLFAVFFSAFFIFISLLMITSSVKAGNAFVVSLIVTLVLVFFMFTQQMMYPKLLINKKVKNVERNLIPALQNMLVQLNSGVSLFETMNTIARQDYGGISTEFTTIVNEINVGKSQADALEEVAIKTPSLFFRRVTWQMVNGMKSGANTADVLNGVLDALNEEKIIQIQKYGGQLNPLAMFYMLAVVIMPSLGMTFLIVLASFISISNFGIKAIFFGMYTAVVFAQLIFMGMIKSKRPNLMGD